MTPVQMFSSLRALRSDLVVRGASYRQKAPIAHQEMPPPNKWSSCGETLPERESKSQCSDEDGNRDTSTLS